MVVFAWIGSLSLLIINALYILLVLGFPYGDFVNNGKEKVLSTRSRLIHVGLILVQLGAILVLLHLGHVRALPFSVSLVHTLCYIFASLMTLEAVSNFVSTSKKEKVYMTTLSVISAACLWLSAISAIG